MAIKANIIVDQGSTFNTTIDITDENDQPLDLSGYAGQAQMRKHYTSSNAVSFDVSVNPVQGSIALSLTANATIQITPGRYVYDVELTDSTGIISRIVEGIVTVTPNVTR